MILNGDSLHAGQFMLAIFVCAALSQSAYAGNPSAASDKNASAGTNIHKNINQSKVPLKSKIKNDFQVIDYNSICIFCHIPNMAIHSNASPLLNNTINFSPKTIQKTKSDQ
jgi:hypothetical protein